LAPNDHADRRIEMTDNTDAGHDCADHGCLAAMLGLDLDEPTEINIS
jgi:hypothetical protein